MELVALVVLVVLVVAWARERRVYGNYCLLQLQPNIFSWKNFLSFLCLIWIMRTVQHTVQ